ncbi:MAG: hypothetical protein JNL41_05895 [Phenylobacterium sp.]|uniref:hypothetical protein n=1 Tax=Phenylobacterium sp. TaxID=1871053 RepID=UPI001A5DED8B|nr:hypothetical protein [Phenylobacterium sp.]MBL8553791.1 hypothetical protein [Phenylobacterium sp.]
MRTFVSMTLAALVAGLPAAAFAEDAAGDWVGKVKVPAGVELTIVAHIQKDGAGKLIGYAESPDQTVTQLPMADIAATADTLSFAVPMVKGSYKGAWDPAARAWVGTLTQAGFDMPLSLARGVAPPRPVVAGLDGEWTGVLAAPQGDLRLLLHVKTGADGTLALFESPDQSPMKLVAFLTHEGDAVKVELKGVGGFEGKLSPDGKTLDGQWKQMGGSLPLTMKKGG